MKVLGIITICDILERTCASLSGQKAPGPTMRRINYEGYIDEKSGLGLKVFDTRIFGIVYFPVPNDRAQCPAYFRRPEVFVEPFFEHVPVVSLDCPKAPAGVGEVLTFKAVYPHGIAAVPTWIVSAGRIVEGQGRTRMKLDTSGLNPGTIEVTVERSDSLGHVAATSCKVQLTNEPEQPREQRQKSRTRL